MNILLRSSLQRGSTALTGLRQWPICSRPYTMQMGLWGTRMFLICALCQLSFNKDSWRLPQIMCLGYTAMDNKAVCPQPAFQISKEVGTDYLLPICSPSLVIISAAYNHSHLGITVCCALLPITWLDAFSQPDPSIIFTVFSKRWLFSQPMLRSQL